MVFMDVQDAAELEHVPKNVARTWLNHDIGDNFNIHIWACYSNFIIRNRLVQ